MPVIMLPIDSCFTELVSGMVEHDLSWAASSLIGCCGEEYGSPNLSLIKLSNFLICSVSDGLFISDWVKERNVLTGIIFPFSDSTL